MNIKISPRSFNAFVAAFAAIVILPTIPLYAIDTPGATDSAPRAIARANPDYSYGLRHDGVEGRVVVSFTVTASGDVAGAAVVSSTQRRLEKPALEAIRKWKFMPAMKAGVPVSSRVIQPIAFTMAD
jgi:periplasmic protein TonB